MIAGHVTVVLLMIRIAEGEGAWRGVQRQSMGQSTDAHLKSVATYMYHFYIIGQFLRKRNLAQLFFPVLATFKANTR